LGEGWNSGSPNRDYCAAQKLIVAIAKIGFFDERDGNQSDLAFGRTPRLVCFRAMVMDCAKTGTGWVRAGGSQYCSFADRCPPTRLQSPLLQSV
jgi:hypothetical protein